MSLNKSPSLTLFICTICICIPSLINNFPFIYSDTGTYLGTGFTKGVSIIRPAMYGIFLRHISLKESFWLVIFAQAFIVAFFIRLFIRTFFKEISEFAVILFVSILTATTSIGIITGMLMPDFTTSILVIVVPIIIYAKELNWKKWILIGIGLWFSIASHHSHAFILVLILFFAFIRIALRSKQASKSHFKRLGLLVFMLVLGYLTIPTIHYLRKGEFFSSKSSNVFLLSRINQMGLLEPFLEEHCEDNNFSICKYKESIPDNFLWDPKSPVFKDEGWEANNVLYKDVIVEFFSSPYYAKRAIMKTLETGIQQFFSFKTVRLDKLEPKQWPHYEFELYMPDCIPSLEQSAQNRGKWSNKVLDFLQHLIVFTSAIFLIYLFLFQDKFKMSTLHRNLIYLILMSLISNAFICGGISMIAPRFQSRIIWIIPLFAICMLYHLWKEKANNQSNFKAHQS